MTRWVWIYDEEDGDSAAAVTNTKQEMLDLLNTDFEPGNHGFEESDFVLSIDGDKMKRYDVVIPPTPQVTLKEVK